MSHLLQCIAWMTEVFACEFLLSNITWTAYSERYKFRIIRPRDEINPATLWIAMNLELFLFRRRQYKIVCEVKNSHAFRGFKSISSCQKFLFLQKASFDVKFQQSLFEDTCGYESVSFQHFASTSPWRIKDSTEQKNQWLFQNLTRACQRCNQMKVQQCRKAKS